MKEFGTNGLNTDSVKMKKNKSDENLHNLDFKSYITFETNYQCECDKYCLTEGICKNNTITDIQIQSINLYGVATKIFNSLNDIASADFKRVNKFNLLLRGYDYKLDIYGIERILSINNLYDIVNWDYTIIRGYYGQEVGQIHPIDELYNRIMSQVQEYLNLETIKNKIDYLLELEYGYLLPQLIEANYTIENIDRKNIFFGQQKRLKDVKDRNLYKDRDKTNIMGICLKDGDSYRVVDGYNRLSQTKYKKVFIIVANYE